MRIAWLASFLHKWLALIVGIQIFIWIATGLFFTIVPIEKVRSEHRLRELAPVQLSAADLAHLPAALEGADAPIRLTIENRPEGARIVADYADGAAALFDAGTGAKLSPLDQESALAIARARIATDAPIASSAFVTTTSPEYRGALPAWRIAFDEPSKLAIYVGADTGQVTARRSELWRVYDFLWSLHIMDYREHENFNHAPIIIVSILAFLSTIAGIALIPYRFRWRRKKQAVGPA
ncbi:MAG: PepSY domain-containing protein [Hyphomonadaceae bacterium]|nr:PepSY domain-containing protein [Hyphomonadaceae bacterium]